MNFGTDLWEKINSFVNEKVSSTYKVPKAVTELQAVKAKLMEQGKMNEDDAAKLIAALFVGEAQKRDQDATAAWNDLPQDIKNVFKYGPEDLKRQQNITLGGAVVSIAAILGAGVAALLGAPFAVIAGIAGLAVLAQMAVNNINDVFHWGPLMGQSNQEDVAKVAESIKISGITDYGKITADDINKLSVAYTKATIPGFIDPKTKELYPSTPEGITKALSSLVGMLNAAGETPTPSEAVQLLNGWAMPPTDRSGKEIVEQMKLSIGGVSTTREMITRITAKPKLFLGTILAGRIGPISDFYRSRDDLITDDADLLKGAETNLASWLRSLPGRLTFKIDIALNPMDENNVPLPGTWAVMTIFVNNNIHKSLPLDVVILGPLKPETYYPETQRVVEIAGSLPNFAKYAPIEKGEIYGPITTPGGYTPIAGAVAAPPGGAAAPTAEKPAEKKAAETAPTTPPPTPPAQPPSAPIITPPEEVGDWTTRAGDGALIYTSKMTRNSVAIRMDLVTSKQAILNSLPIWLASGYFSKIDVDAIANKLGASLIPAPGTTPTAPIGEATFEGGYKGTKITEKNVSVNIDVLLVRAGPSTSQPLAGTERLYRADTFKVIGWVYGQDVSGENRWWVSSLGHYVWVGGTTEKP